MTSNLHIMINEYYILRDNEKQGPYSHTELMDMEVNATELVLSPLVTDWQEAAELPEFDEYFKSIGVYIPTQQNVANFGWRLLAFVIDYVMLFVAAAIAFVTCAVIMELLKKGTTDRIEDEIRHNLLKFRLIVIGLFIFYHTIFESTKLQSSVGKIICRMTVVDSNGQRLTFTRALQRNASKLLSSLLCGVGFLVSIWSPMKQCWHDQVAKTFIVRKPN